MVPDTFVSPAWIDIGPSLAPSRIALVIHRPSRMLKNPPASFSLRSEVQRTEAYASPLRSLWPCWTAILSILPGVFPLCDTGDPPKIPSVNLVFPQLVRRPTHGRSHSR